MLDLEIAPQRLHGVRGGHAPELQHPQLVGGDGRGGKDLLAHGREPFEGRHRERYDRRVAASHGLGERSDDVAQLEDVGAGGLVDRLGRGRVYSDFHLS